MKRTRKRKTTIPGNECLSLAERRKVWNARYQAKHPERVKDSKRRCNDRPESKAAKQAYRLRNADKQRLAAAAAQRARYAADPERGRAKQRAWAAKQGRAHLAEIRKRGYEKNREEIILVQKNNIARRKAVYSAGTITLADWRAIIAMHDGCCVYCGERSKMTMDHIVPLSRGGEHSAMNIVPACRECNSSKHNKLLHEWLRERAAIGKIA